MVVFSGESIVAVVSVLVPVTVEVAAKVMISRDNLSDNNNKTTTTIVHKFKVGSLVLLNQFCRWRCVSLNSGKCQQNVIHRPDVMPHNESPSICSIRLTQESITDFYCLFVSPDCMFALRRIFIFLSPHGYER